VAYDLEEAIKKSRLDSLDVRKGRLKNSIKIPAKVQVTTVAYKRNPDC